MTFETQCRAWSALVVGAAALGLGASTNAQAPGEDRLKELRPIPIVADAIPTARAVVGQPRKDKPDFQFGTCPPIRGTYSSADFSGGEFVLQAGFVESEVAAVSITLTPTDFPVIFNAVEMIVAAQSLIVETTTQYSILIWEGTPATGTLIDTISSDGLIIPHVVMPPSPGPQGVNVNVVIDPEDPDQVVINNDGSNTFSVGFRIDVHNNPPTSSCNLGLTPAACCPPATNSNAFPTTDTPPPGTPNFLSQNWLFCRFNCGLLACPGGWHRFSNLGAFRPSGDWNMAVTYTPFDCDPGAGACCLPSGQCTLLNSEECGQSGGTFQGIGTNCADVDCDPDGACCIDGQCGDAIPESDCVAAGGVWLGPDTVCDASSCLGGCCVPATGGCLELDEDTCTTVVLGLFQGVGTDCTIICFPVGACCLPDGTCDDMTGAGMSPEDCATLGGVFQGDGSDCGTVVCPDPVGACCLPGGCLVLTEANCGVAGGAWSGPDTECGSCDSCPEDLDGDAQVGFTDLTQLLGAWGPCMGCPEDFDGDDQVGFTDLTQLLGVWGPC